MMYISGAKAENVTERKSTVEINSSVTKDSTQPLNLAKEEVLRGKSLRTDIRAGAEAETVGGAEEGIEPEVRVEIRGYRNQTAGIAVEAGAEAELETGTQAGAGAEMITTGEDMSTTAEVRAVEREHSVAEKGATEGMNEVPFLPEDR
jgi:hypothetical protein